MPSPRPNHIANLRRDVDGVPVPWFARWVGDVPTRHEIGAGKLDKALSENRCWLCGEQLGRHLAFLVVPFAVLSRISPVPPSHRSCAEYAASYGMGPLPSEPPVVLVYSTLYFHHEHTNSRGPLFRLAEPTGFLWYAAGRPALRAQVEADLDKGLALFGNDGGVSRGWWEEISRRHRFALTSLPHVELAG